MTSNELTLRRARALIRYRVRERLARYEGQDVLNTRFLVNRIDLASEAYEYQTAVDPDGITAKIEDLIGVARDELLDFVLLQDRQNQVDFSERANQIPCEACSFVYDYSTEEQCPSCDWPNLFQATELTLDEIVSQLELGTQDPVVRNAVADIQPAFVDLSYPKLVSCFESFHRRLNELLFAQKRRKVKESDWRNRFQNLRGTLEWFTEEHGYNPYSDIDEDARSLLSLVFNKRHVIEHNGAVIDQDYLRKTGRGKVGEPVRLSRGEILQAVRIIRRIVGTARNEFLQRMP